MLTKKNLWFLTLFSIIVVMAVYYISVPSIDSDITVNKDISSSEEISVNVNESSAITALRVNRDESLEKEVEAIKEILMDGSKTIEEKSDAYEALKSLNTNKGKEENLESLIKEKFNYENFIKIDGNKVKIVIDSKEHSYDLANKIMSTIESEFDKKIYVTVSFNAQ